MADRAIMPSISYVVARSEPGHVIGCDNRLPWNLKTDLQNFKKITTDHVIVMGRKTFDSIGRPLPNRINIVMSSKTSSEIPSLFFADSKGSALYLADFFSVLNGYKDIFVIGGGTVYEEFKQVFNKIYLTEVYGSAIEGDAFFNYDFNSKEWSLTGESHFPQSEVDEFPFAVRVFERKFSEKNRARLLAQFLKPDENLKDWELKQLEKINLAKAKAKLQSAIQLDLPNIQNYG